MISAPWYNHARQVTTSTPSRAVTRAVNAQATRKKTGLSVAGPRNNAVGRRRRPPACYIPPMSDPFELTGPAPGAPASADAAQGADLAHLEGLNEAQRAAVEATE